MYQIDLKDGATKKKKYGASDTRTSTICFNSVRFVENFGITSAALISACMDSGNVLCSNQSKQNLLRCQLIKRNPKPILFSRVFPCLSPVFKTQRKTLKSLPRLFQFYRYTRSYLGTISYANRSVCSDLHSDFEKVCHDFFNLTGNLAHA